MPSHAAPHTITCPNCGNTATGNYCAQCGQATHLHKDTFWGLVTHFIAHYFHFESKFWQTMRALMVRPGALTLAYLARQRARHVPPMSLYIFVAVAFFILSSPIEKGYQKLGWMPRDTATTIEPAAPDTTGRPLRAAANRFERIADRMAASDSAENDRILESYLPKVFFFMIPVLAAILWLLMLRNPCSTFVVNSIFALHFQAAAFIIQLLGTILPFIPDVLILLASVIYLAVALRRVYALRAGRAIAVSLGAAFLYLFVLLAVIIFLGVVMASSTQK